jgi:hypothetical protein
MYASGVWTFSAAEDGIGYPHVTAPELLGIVLNPGILNPGVGKVPIDLFALERPNQLRECSQAIAMIVD